MSEGSLQALSLFGRFHVQGEADLFQSTACGHQAPAVQDYDSLKDFTLPGNRLAVEWFQGPSCSVAPNRLNRCWFGGVH